MATRAIVRKRAISRQENQFVLRQIRDLLRERLSPPAPKKPWWRSGKLPWIASLLVALCFLDFPSESRMKADLIVYNGTELSLIKLPEPDWTTLGVRPSPEFWRVPNLRQGVIVDSLWDFSLFRQGRRYKHSAIRVIQNKDEPSADFLQPPVRIQGPTVILVARIGEFNDDRTILANTILPTHALKWGDEFVPLTQVMEPKNDTGNLIVEIKPRIGWERFESNLNRAFGLLK